MLFNSLTYLVFFLVVLIGYWSLPGHRMRLVWLLAASWFFYAAWYPIYLLLFLLTTAINYFLAVGIGDKCLSNPILAKRLVWATAIMNLGCLGLFKYFDFFMDSVSGLAEVAGWHWKPPAMRLFLPLGISFHTFQCMAYVVDVYRGGTTAIRNPLKLSLFISFFPQLIAGPIVRTNEFLPQLMEPRRFSWATFMHGLDLIGVGLFKKIFIADQLSPFVDQVFSNPAGLGSGTLLLAVYAYAAQIYCDFSGYTDIGRGCAYCMGYELPVNFRHPYFSCNIVDFWRRWHITLSSWLRDYLYIPLGGNRRGQWNTYRNLMITMMLGGLWHGASWTFVIWGTLHGLMLCITRWVHQLRGVKPEQPLFGGLAYRILATVVTFHLVCLAWIFFRAPTLGAALDFLRGIASVHLLGSRDLAAVGYLSLGLVTAAMLIITLLHGASVKAGDGRLGQSRAWAIARPLAYFAVAVGVLLFAGRGAQQFIYFQF